MDYKQLPGVDVVADVRQLPFKDNSVEVIETYHTIEHIPRQEITLTLKDWFRALKRDGKLMIELPDFDQNCRDYLGALETGDDQSRVMNLMFIYGGDTPAPEDAHRWAYTPSVLTWVLHKVGFKDVVSADPQNAHAGQAACMRMECRKR